MAGRRRKPGLAGYALALAAKLPWWAGVGLAAVSHIVLFLAGAVISAVHQHRRKGLLDTAAQRDVGANVRGLIWREFERLVEEFYRRQGYTVRKFGGDGPDGGVDLLLTLGREQTLVQCKHWRATRVGVSVVRELYGVMAAQGAAEGVVVTSGGFTPDAVEFAAGRNLRLIAGPAL